MKKETGLTIAGVLLLLVAFWSLLIGGGFITINVLIDDPQTAELLQEGYDEYADQLKDMGIEDFDEFKDWIGNIFFPIGVITLIEGIITLLGAICIFMRRLFMLPVVGSILGMLNLASWGSFFVLVIISIVALYLIWKGKDLFGQKINREPML